MSTITVPNPVPDTNEDCIALHRAFEGAVLWMCNPAERDATILHEALGGLIKDYRALTEVLYLRTSAELLDIRRAYSSSFDRSLEEEIATKIGGSEQKLLLGLLREERIEDDEIDTLEVEADTEDLLSALSNTEEINISVIVRVLTTRSSSHLKDILDRFMKVYGYNFEQILENKTRGAFRVSVTVVMCCAKDSINYYAKTLYESLKGICTDASTLIRIIVTCAETNMKDIKASFSRNYEKQLHDMISSDTMRHFQTFLMLLVGVSHHENILQHLPSLSPC
ncbi:hypothetical protein KP509_31G020100 [Ceratopteris richardii]|uniref:Annexin n=1 Tax=Ceratopteris richardii TaxID=49495 RepID=A0A8T2QXS7_CERRI|nr:hypothetical protein KP509_31G020100 [Ceratopteris richardii]